MILNIYVAPPDQEETMPVEAKKLRTQFWDLYLNYTQAKRAQQVSPAPSFAPRINPNSQLIVAKMFTTQSCQERLLDKGKEYAGRRRDREVCQCRALIAESRPPKRTPTILK